MRGLFILLLFTLLAFSARPQIPELQMLDLKTYGGTKVEIIAGGQAPYDPGSFDFFIYSKSPLSGSNLGIFCNSDSEKVICLRYDLDGNYLETLLCVEIGGSSDTLNPSCLFLEPDDSRYIIGNIPYVHEMVFRKEDKNENVLFHKVLNKGLNSYAPQFAIRDGEGGFIVIGGSLRADSNINHYGGNFNVDIMLARLDSLGNLIWIRNYGGSRDENGWIIPGPPGSFYVAGSTRSSDYDMTGDLDAGFSSDMFIARFRSADGSLIWHKFYGGSDGGDITHAVSNGKQGVVASAGSSSTDGDIKHNPTGKYTAWIFEIDSAGAIVWENSYDGTPENICKATDGNLWVTGSTNYKKNYDHFPPPPIYVHNQGDAYVMRLDSVGNFLASKLLWGSSLNGSESGTMIYPLKNGKAFVAGIYASSDGSFAQQPARGQHDVFTAVFAPWTTGVNDANLSRLPVTVYPNPAASLIKIVSGTKDVLTCTIYDMNGRKVFQQQFIEKAEIPTASWSNGTYVLKIISEDKSSYQTSIQIHHR